MADVKVSASFILQGSVLPAEPPCSKKGKKERKEEKEKNENFYRQEVIRLRNNKQIVINLRKRYDEKSCTLTFLFPSKSPRPDSGRYGNGDRQCHPQ